MPDYETTPRLPGYISVSSEVDIPNWALTAHPNEIRAMMAQAYPNTHWLGIGGAIWWHDLLKWSEDRVTKEQAP